MLKILPFLIAITGLFIPSHTHSTSQFGFATFLVLRSLTRQAAPMLETRASVLFCVLISYQLFLLSLCSGHTGLFAAPQINEAFPVLGPVPSVWNAFSQIALRRSLTSFESATRYYLCGAPPRTLSFVGVSCIPTLRCFFLLSAITI